MAQDKSLKVLQPLNCSICLEDYEYAGALTTKLFVSIGCRHFYHLECFRAYVVTRRPEDELERERSCPVCRNKIEKIQYKGKSVTVQQMLERSKWQTFKNTHGLTSKEEGLKLVTEKIYQLFDHGNFDKLVHDEYSIILKHLTSDITDDEMKGNVELRHLFATITFFMLLSMFH